MHLVEVSDDLATPNEAVALAKIVQHDPWLEFGGLMFYPIRWLASHTGVF